ncbi:MAG: DJ-1/PfpI family protein [Spirochaetales bacterium]|nr:DJ-1/PfpI family protein [Spirochaetales bacterium]
MKVVYILLADGFEEIEFIAPYDLLKRADNKVVTIGVTGKSVTGGHGLLCEADLEFSEIESLPDCLVVPGGLNGAKNIANSDMANKLIAKCADEGRIVASLCASPAVVLSPLGLLDGKIATCYPGFEQEFSHSTRFSKEKVVVDGNLITSRGPGCAYDFALAIISHLNSKEKADEIAQKTVYKL